LQRTIILFFLLLNKNENSYINQQKVNIIEKINKINTITGANISFFIKNVENLKSVCYKIENEGKKKNDIKRAEEDLKKFNCDVESNDEEMVEKNKIEDEQILEKNSEKKKKNKKIEKKKKKVNKDKEDDYSIQSGETSILFNYIFLYFYEFIKENLNKFEIKNLLIHKKILDLIFQFDFEKEEIDYLKFLCKKRYFLLLDNQVKITPKLCLEQHYGDYIYFCGPLRYLWCWSFENHHSTQKKEVELRSRNLGITSFNNNFLFTELNYNQLHFEKLIETGKTCSCYKILKIDKKIIQKNSVIELTNGKIGVVSSIYKFPTNVVLEIYMLDVISDELGIFLYVEKIKKKSKKIYLFGLKAIYNVEQKNNKTILLNKVYLFK
jgi:hypothetical protein